MPSKKKKAPVADPRKMYATTSVQSRAKADAQEVPLPSEDVAPAAPQEASSKDAAPVPRDADPTVEADASAPVAETATLGGESDAVTATSAGESDAVPATSAAESDAASRSLPPPVLPPPRLRKDWKEWPQGLDASQKSELAKRLLQCVTKLGVVASVHLEKVDVRRNIGVHLGRSVYSWIFDSHHVVMGDMNCEWRNMIGGAQVDNGRGIKPEQLEAWVKATTHAAAIRPGGTYLPGITAEKSPRWKGDKVTVDPPTYDLVVVCKPLSVEVDGRQPGRKLTSAKLPRSLIQKLPWPSDHTSVVATVRAAHDAMTVSTWNVADPWYLYPFWPDAAFGFGAGPGLNTQDRAVEEARREAITRHVVQLLEVSDVLGLQEVPAALVHPLAELGSKRGFEVQWVAAPTAKDEEWHAKAAGRRGSSSAAAVVEAARALPPVMHDMLFARAEVLTEGVEQTAEVARVAYSRGDSEG